MNKILLYIALTLIFLSLSSCTPQSKIESDYFFIDIRVNEEEKIKINNKIIHSAYLDEYLKSQDYPSNTNGRIIISENTNFNTLNNITNALAKTFNEGVFKIKVFSHKEFQQLGTEIFYIDIINENKVLIEGNLIHPNNLEIAIKSFTDSLNSKQPKFHISYNEDLPFYLINDIQTKINRYSL